MPLKENLFIRNSILRLAKKHNTAVWDFFKIMGGFLSVNQWHEENLISYDFLHLIIVHCFISSRLLI